MICDVCFEKIKESTVGKTNNAEQKCIGLSRTTNTSYAFGIDFYPLYITYEEPIKRGKNKGGVKKAESSFLLKTKFCCMCGEEKKKV